MTTKSLDRAAGIATLVLALAGCDDDAYRRYGDDIHYAAAEALLASGPRHLDLKLAPAPGYLLAHAFEIESDDELLDDELVVGPLDTLELDRGTCGGTLTIGGIEVRFDEAVTELDESCGRFVERLRSLDARGDVPRIAAARRPSRMPQDPADPTFFATRITIEEEQADAAALTELEVNVSPENVLACDLLGERPDGCIGGVEALGRRVIVRRDFTDVETELPLELVYVDLEARIATVDPNDRVITLDDGTPVRVVDATVLEGGDLSLLQQRIAAGDVLVLEAETVVQRSVPIALVAIEATWSARIDGELDEDDEERRTVVTGPVLDVEPRLGLVTLPFGTDVWVGPNTVVDGDLRDIGELDRAIGSGTQVRAEAIGPIEARTPRMAIRADRLRVTVVP